MIQAIELRLCHTQEFLWYLSANSGFWKQNTKQRNVLHPLRKEERTEEKGLESRGLLRSRRQNN